MREKQKREREREREREGKKGRKGGRKGGGEEERKAPFSSAEASGLPEDVVMVRNFLSTMKCIQSCRLFFFFFFHENPGAQNWHAVLFLTRVLLVEISVSPLLRPVLFSAPSVIAHFGASRPDFL